jgi:hypothetical protein
MKVKKHLCLGECQSIRLSEVKRAWKLWDSVLHVDISGEVGDRDAFLALRTLIVDVSRV